MANDSDARIVLGGKQSGFFGYLPGIVEETYHSLSANKSVYLLGGFGGATKSITSAINGKRPEELSNEYQFDTGFLKEFRRYSSNKSTIDFDYGELITFFQGYGVELLSKRNGLSIEENQILFESTNIYELVFLIIKGLKNTTNELVSQDI